MSQTLPPDRGIEDHTSSSQRARVRSRVLVAISGGVDSAVAAALLAEQGHQVVAAHLLLRTDATPTREAASRARDIARHLGIPFHLIDARDAFSAQVVDYFVTEYAAGRTPNPCVVCNRTIKFGLLLNVAIELGADRIATGHYARVQAAGDGYQLLRGVDGVKDQSYFLHALDQAQLTRSMFPLGPLTKEKVRAIARERGLPVCGVTESQDICFLSGTDYRGFLTARTPHLLRPGPIRDSSGAVMGEHRGLPAYTIGQRKGLGISAAEPLYVVKIDVPGNALIVGPADALQRNECTLARVHYVSGSTPAGTFEAEAQIRYRARPSTVMVAPLPGGAARVRFQTAQRAITPGQFLVLYDGKTVLGGGTIVST